MKARIAALVAVACATLAGAGPTGATSAFHNTEKHGFGSSLLPSDAKPGSGWIRGHIVIVKGKPSATIVWRLALTDLGRQAVEVTLRSGWVGDPGMVVVRLCAACRSGATGRITVATSRPWFRADRATGRVPRLTAELRTVRQPIRTLRGAMLIGPFRAYNT